MIFVITGAIHFNNFFKVSYEDNPDSVNYIKNVLTTNVYALQTHKLGSKKNKPIFDIYVSKDNKEFYLKKY